jgi:cytidine deaminase
MEQKIIKTIVNVCSIPELEPEIQVLISKAKEQIENAYAPYSGFHVGAAVLLQNGALFVGSNQENAAYPSGLCAERVALFYANAQFPGVPVKALAVAAFTNNEFLAEPVTPCGACRQVILESETRFENSIDIYLYGTNYVYHIANAHDLLPLSFVKDSLG